MDASKQAGGVKSDYHTEATFSVEPDGTFKTSPTSPAYAGAIGDDGLTFSPIGASIRPTTLSAKS